MVLILATVTFLFVSWVVDQAVVDKRFYKEVEEHLKANHLLKLAKTDLEEAWSEMDDLDVREGLLYYPNGDVFYRKMSENEELLLVELYSSTLAERKGICVISYDKNLRKVVKWMEN